ncbi:hypothetical protein [Paenibacillus sp. FSL H7-0326]|uniref:hypothetical protein n=1 Tax=Paenibacillus sp. FSL H7-0326 TaxID=1921144 RepID=UPI0021160B6D|nr:hypothetical protein [Paenibacillus sp. FSL H7-0326]
MMEWCTFSNMIGSIKIGQKASTPGYSRTVIRKPDGLYWSSGLWNGRIVEIKDYLFSDIWTIYEDEESLVWFEYREEAEQKELEKIKNQYEAERERLRDERDNSIVDSNKVWKNKDVY